MRPLASEPSPPLVLEGPQIDDALAAMGDFADLISPYLVGHSAGVAELVMQAARRCQFPAAEVLATRRAALSPRCWTRGYPCSHLAKGRVAYVR